MHHDDVPFFAYPGNWVAISTILFVLIFGRKIWAALTQILDNRAKEIQAELTEASRLRQEAEAMREEAQAQRQAALADAQKLLAGAQAEAARVTAVAIAEAEASTRRRERMALDRIAAAEKAAIDEVRFAAAEIATIATRDVISETLSQDADTRLVDHAIGQLPTALRAA